MQPGAGVGGIGPALGGLKFPKGDFAASRWEGPSVGLSLIFLRIPPAKGRMQGKIPLTNWWEQLWASPAFWLNFPTPTDLGEERVCLDGGPQKVPPFFHAARGGPGRDRLPTRGAGPPHPLIAAKPQVFIYAAGMGGRELFPGSFFAEKGFSWPVGPLRGFLEIQGKNQQVAWGVRFPFGRSPNDRGSRRFRFWGTPRLKPGGLRRNRGALKGIVGASPRFGRGLRFAL